MFDLFNLVNSDSDLSENTINQQKWDKQEHIIKSAYTRKPYRKIKISWSTMRATTYAWAFCPFLNEAAKISNLYLNKY